MGSHKIRRLRSDEWETWRDLRLQALTDAPDSFGLTLADAQSSSDSDWQLYCTQSALRYLLLSEDERGPNGMAVLQISDDEKSADIFAMWVSPTARGQGVGNDLLMATLEIARRNNVAEVTLRATDGNEMAQRLYERAGFKPTGEKEPLREGSTKQLSVMSLNMSQTRNAV